MHEGGIADDGNGLAGHFRADLGEAVGHADGCAHANGGVHGKQRHHGAQSVAADIAGDGELQLVEHGEQSAMGAAGAHDRRTAGQSLIYGDSCVGFEAHGLHDPGLGKLAQHAGQVLAAVRHDAQHAHVIFDNGIQFFYYIEFFYGGGEILYELGGHGPCHAELQHACLRKNFLYILVAGAGADDAGGVALFDAVDAALFGVLDELLCALFNDHMAADGVAGAHDVLADVLGVLLEGYLHAVAQFHDGLGVSHAGAGADYDGSVKFFRQFVGKLGELKAFAGIGGLQHGNLGGFRIVAGILLILRGVHARVVGDGDDHAAVHAGVAHGEQGVGGHVQADMLHCAEAAGTGHGCADGGFHGDLLIGGPFGVHFRILCGFFGYFGRGSAGIRRDKAAASLVKATRDGGVAQHKLFHG